MAIKDAFKSGDSEFCLVGKWWIVFCGATDCISIDEAYGTSMKGKYQEGGNAIVNRSSAPWQPDELVTAVRTGGG